MDQIWYVQEFINKNWHFTLPRYRRCIKCNKIEKRYGDFWIETKVCLPLQKVTTETEIDRLTKINNILNENSL